MMTYALGVFTGIFGMWFLRHLAEKREHRKYVKRIEEEQDYDLNFMD